MEVKLIFIIIDDSSISGRREYLYKLFIRFPLIFILLSWGSLFDRFMSFVKIEDRTRNSEREKEDADFIQEKCFKQIFNKLIFMLGPEVVRMFYFGSLEGRWMWTYHELQMIHDD